MEMAKRNGNKKSEATFHMSHSRARMTAYMKASPGTTVKVANRTILPLDVFRATEVGLDQPDTTTKPVKVVAVAYGPELPWDLLSTRKALEQGGTPLVHYKTKAVLGFPVEESIVFNFYPRKGLFSELDVKRIPGQGAAMVVATKARDIMEVHHILAHPSEERTQKTAEVMVIATTDQWGPYEACLQAKVKGHAVLKMTDKRANVK